MLETDFLIVGAGIAGASVAYRLSAHAKVILIDMEDQAGYHTTGRSAAFYAETYGGPLVQPFTSASKPFFHNPPVGFSDVPLISNLGAIYVYTAEEKEEASRLFKALNNALPNVKMMSAAEVTTALPHLQMEDIVGGIHDLDCSSLDVAALHQGFLKAAKLKGARLYTGASLKSAAFDGEYWCVTAANREIKAKVLINAAGAWADDVAMCVGARPVGLQPLRRTVVTIDNPDNLVFSKASPMVMRVGAEYYFKPEGNGYLLSPGDEVLMPPCDVQPEEEDVALAVHQFEQATGTEIGHVDAKWAGLRTFAEDRAPIIGFAPDIPNFFWSVGHGGFGIQTAPAWSALAAAILLGKPVPEQLEAFGVKAEAYTPARFFT